MERSPPGGDPRAISAKSFAHALRAYHGTLAPRWDFHPPRPAPFQLPAVAPSRSARPRAPHPQPNRPGVVPSPAARRLIWPWARKVLLGNEAPCIIIREFFTTVREGSSPQEELPSPLDSTHITSHRRRDRHRCPRRNPNPHLGGGTSASDMQRRGRGGMHVEVPGVAAGHNKRASEARE